jgi:hypothetical protein
MLGGETLLGSKARALSLWSQVPPSPRTCQHRPRRGPWLLQPAAVAAPETTASTNGAAAADGSAYIRPHLRQLAAYTPIEPFEVLSARLGRRPEDIVKLDANENPYGPPPEVRQALGAMPFPNIYPDPETRRLRGALADLHSVPAENLLVRAAAPCAAPRCP